MNDDMKKMKEAIAFLRREVCGEITATHMELFLTIGMLEGITQHQLTKDFKMPHGTISRNIKMLAQFCEEKDGRDEIKGYDLAETTPDLRNRRRMACFLTKRGKLVFASIKNILKGESS